MSPRICYLGFPGEEGDTSFPATHTAVDYLGSSVTRSLLSEQTPALGSDAPVSPASSSELVLQLTLQQLQPAPSLMPVAPPCGSCTTCSF